MSPHLSSVFVSYLPGDTQMLTNSFASWAAIININNIKIKIILGQPIFFYFYPPPMYHHNHYPVAQMICYHHWDLYGGLYVSKDCLYFTTQITEKYSIEMCFIIKPIKIIIWVGHKFIDQFIWFLSSLL